MNVLQEKLSEIFPEFKITVAKKADATYPIVSAASICAKVSRDTALKVWTFQEGLEATSVDFGSGYPNGKWYRSMRSESNELT
jgi:ribonuclease H2 subunit A